MGFFDTSEAYAFADEVADEYSRIQTRARSGSALAGKDGQRAGKLVQKVAAFNAQKKPNFYKRTMLLWRIRQRLEGAGVPAAEVQKLTQDILSAFLRPPQ